MKSHPCPQCGAEMKLVANKIRPYKGNKKTYVCTVCDQSDTLYADHEQDLTDFDEEELPIGESVMCRHGIPIDECIICEDTDY